MTNPNTNICRARRLAAILLMTLTLASLFATAGQTRRKATTPAKASLAAEPKFAPRAESPMAKTWRTGELPESLPVAEGASDAQIAELARAIAARNERSTPALLAALQLAGFFITAKDGSMLYTPPDGRGIGLPINGWEVASVARTYDDGRRTNLAELGQRLRSIPVLSKLEMADILVEGIRTHADSNKNPFLRNWARLIVELGKASPSKYDILAGARPADIEIDTIQHLLIMRRLYGDLWARAEKDKPADVATWSGETNTDYEPTPKRASGPSHVIETVETSSQDDTVQASIPCRMDGNAPTIADAKATAMGVAWDQLLGKMEDSKDVWTEKAGTRYSMFLSVANTILAYAKFIQTYAALETRIMVENADPLIRTKNVVPGGRKQLSSEVRMNIGNWQMYNCIRFTMNYTTGLDFATLNDGPLGDVGVQWALTEGGDHNNGTNNAGEQIVGFAAATPKRIQDPGVGVQNVRNLTFTKTDDKGITSNILEGTPQKNAKIGSLTEVRKQARVVTSIKLKAGEIKGDMVDVAGQAIAAIPGLITMPTELLYRTSWAAGAAMIVPVTDWEECKRGWSGTVSIVRKQVQSSNHPPSDGVRVRTEHSSSTFNYKYQGSVEIDASDFRSSSGIATVQLKGKSNAISVKMSSTKMISSYSDNCGSKTTKRILEKEDRHTEAGSGPGEATGYLNLNLLSGEYSFQVVIPGLPGQATKTWTRLPSGYCRPEDNQPEGKSSNYSVEIPRMAIEVEDGILDLNNPDIIEGERSFTESNGDEVEIKWSLRNCR